VRVSEILEARWFEEFMGWLAIAMLVVSLAGLLLISASLLWPDGQTYTRVYTDEKGCYVEDSYRDGTRPTLVGKVVMSLPRYRTMRRYLAAQTCEEIQ
jgi:hypothetical protein